MRFPVDTVYVQDQDIPITLENVKEYGMNFGFPYPQWVLDLYPYLPKVHKGKDFPTREGQKGYIWKSGLILNCGEDPVSKALFIHMLHDDQSHSWTWHWKSLAVKNGQYAEEGAEAGECGKTGYATAPHVHLEIKKDGNFIDPLTLFIMAYKYIVDKNNDQYVVFDSPKVALGIADVEELNKLLSHGLIQPLEQGEVPAGHIKYPAIETSRLKDIFNL